MTKAIVLIVFLALVNGNIMDTYDELKKID